ncbi:L,D-transpeptidase family protein [Dechloromonas sp.]|uniref:L,D-transpeptidase family protein n=1 Tax=Dechloromonas sp. TaxID=1917218 RepID=UPI00286DF843|nr:L,D-transpeptidase family protein [Dechloromonas sp.]
MPPSPTTVSSPIAASSRQLLLVVAPAWDSKAARLRRFERTGNDDDWQPVGPAIAVSLGRAGLAWGRGFHPPVEEREKSEGDGCAPAGIFAITALFGYAAPDSPFARAARLPYLAATPDLKAIDDPASAHYNRIVDQSTVADPDWASCEDMLRPDERYAVGAVVAHNAEPPVPGAGSCIFLHVWAGQGVPTAGCTAMALADMSEIAGWLDASAAPLLVQLPQAEYAARRAAWGLPTGSMPMR